MIPLAIALTLLVSRPVFASVGPIGQDWFLTSNIVGPAFYSAFNWEAIVDPTHGRVCVNPLLLTGYFIDFPIGTMSTSLPQ